MMKIVKTEKYKAKMLPIMVLNKFYRTACKDVDLLDKVSFHAIYSYIENNKLKFTPIMWEDLFIDPKSSSCEKSR